MQTHHVFVFSLSSRVDSLNWVLFPPAIVIDAALGVMWELSLNLEGIRELISDPRHLISILLSRRNSKSLILDIIKAMTTASTGHVDLPDMGWIFNKINIIYRAYLDTALQSQVNITHTWCHVGTFT